MDVQLYMFINGAWKEYNPKPAAHSHAWSEITGKPTTFNPSSHSHSISNITNLQSTLDSKLPQYIYNNETSINVTRIQGETGMPSITMDESNASIILGSQDGVSVSVANEPVADSHAATKKYVDDKIDGTIVPVVGYSSTASGTTAKVASTSSSRFKMSGYKKGQIYIVQFFNGNTALNPTLNINSYGAKTIRQLTTNGSTATSVGSSSLGLINIPQRAIVSFLYDGTYMIPIGVATNQGATKPKLYIDQLYRGTQQMDGSRQILLEEIHQWHGLYDQYMMTVTIKNSMGDVLETHTYFNSITPSFVEVESSFAVGVDDIDINLYIEGVPSRMYEVSIWAMTV